MSKTLASILTGPCVPGCRGLTSGGPAASVPPLRFLLGILAVGLLFAPGAIPLHAQTGSGTVRGMVVDPSGATTVFPFLLQVGEETQDVGGLDIDQIELSDSLSASGGTKTEQQDDAVPVAVNGMRARSAKPGQIIGEVVANDRAEEIR